MEALVPYMTCFCRFMTDNVRCTPYKPVQISPHDSERPTRIGKNQVTKDFRGKKKRQPYSINGDRLLVKLKEERKLAWEEITNHFSGRKSSSL
jgi:hypothetical protein